MGLAAGRAGSADEATGYAARISRMALAWENPEQPGTGAAEDRAARRERRTSAEG
jgi:hypothetical protein